MRPVCSHVRCVPALTDLAAVLFDMDGTLVNSHAVVERTWRDWALAHDLDPVVVLQGCHGSPAEMTVRRHRADLDDARVALEVARLAERECADLEGVVACEGAHDVLRVVNDSGTPWAVVTSASPALALARLAAAGISDPPVLVTVADVTRGKPDPEGFLLAAHRWGVSIAECLAVEDSPPGLLAARRAGAHVLAVGPNAASLTDVARHWG